MRIIETPGPKSAATEYRVGTASWTDPTLLASGFYPRDCRRPESRLRFYAEQFDTVEVDSSYYALPSERNAALWVERTPANFLFHVKAFAWLTLHDAEVRSLPASIRGMMQADELKHARAPSPSSQLRELAFDIFLRALEPLRAARKLGCLLFQFPPWFVASDRNREYVAFCRRRCGGDSIAVEFRHSSWLGIEEPQTLTFLRDNEITFVTTDAPLAPSIPRTPFHLTTGDGYVRLHGRDAKAWFRRGASAAERFRYLYSDVELRSVAARIRSLGPARRVSVVFNNCYSDYGVRNASMMRQLLMATGRE